MRRKIAFNLIYFSKNKILIIVCILIMGNRFLLCENNFFNSFSRNNEVLLTKTIIVEKTNEKVDYLKSFDKLNDEVNKLISKNIGGTQSEMSKSAYEAYIIWDKELNIIYCDLKERLTDEEFIKLRNEEEAWINYKEEIAKDNAKKYEGGSAYNFVLNISLAQLTRERCYYLVTTYM